MVAGCDR